MVGNSLATKLIQKGHEVTMGSRTANNEAAQKWASSLGERAHTATFRDAAAFGEIVISCTGGMHSMEALESVGVEPLRNKILIDVSNPLQQDKDGSMILGFCNTEAILTNGKVTEDQVGAHGDLMDNFPYLGPPHGSTPKGMK